MSDHERVERAVVMFEQSVTSLVGPRFDRIEGRYVTRASRYTEMCESLADRTGSHSKAHARSVPNLWLDGAQWLRDVDRTIAGWQTGQNTPERLHTLTDASWRPQDLGVLTDYTNALLDWAKSADELLEPPHVYELDGDCPDCGKRYIYRHDSAGDNVRSSALTATVDSAECGNCHRTWTPAEFRFLGLLIGCATPQGISDTA